MSGSDGPRPWSPYPRPRRRSSTWMLIGSVVSGLAIIFGVMIVAFFILLVIAFNSLGSSYGSSK